MFQPYLFSTLETAILRLLSQHGLCVMHGPLDRTSFEYNYAGSMYPALRRDESCKFGSLVGPRDSKRKV
jgi:hypothetical protein